MIWWIAIAVIAVVVFFFKYHEIKHKFSFFVAILLILFVVGSFSSVYANNDLDLSTFEGAMHAGKMYFLWLGGAVGNLANIGAYAVKQDWYSENATKYVNQTSR